VLLDTGSTWLPVKRAEQKDAERLCWQCLQVHNVPNNLKTAMQDHLRLHFSSQEASDEEVLAIYPAAIRRRILRHLYTGSLKRCYLFQVLTWCCCLLGMALCHLAPCETANWVAEPPAPPRAQGCRRKFLDAVLGASRIEMFMPGVEVMSEGDHVHELHIVVAGTIKVGARGSSRSW
jgi:hypothetical protein